MGRGVPFWEIPRLALRFRLTLRNTNPFLTNETVLIQEPTSRTLPLLL